MAFSGLAFVNLFILTCVYPHQSFFYGIVYGGGRRGKGEGRRRGKKGEKREGGGRRGKEGEKREGGGWLCFCDKTSQTGFIA